jgi:hypothetical protein
MAGAGMAAGEKSNALCPPRLPEDGIYQVQPDPNLLAEIRAFFGNWQGRWMVPGGDPDHAPPTIMVVEKIMSQVKVMVVLGWGECPICKSEASCQRFWSKIGVMEGKQVFSCDFPQGKTYAFILEGERLTTNDGTGHVSMSRLGS